MESFICGRHILENSHSRKIWEDEVGSLLERGKEELVYGCVGDR